MFPCMSTCVNLIWSTLPNFSLANSSSLRPPSHQWWLELNTNLNKLILSFEVNNMLLLFFFMFPVHCFFEAIWREFDYSLLFTIFINLSDWVCFVYISYNCIAGNTCFVFNGGCNFLKFILLPRFCQTTNHETLLPWILPLIVNFCL